MLKLGRNRYRRSRPRPMHIGNFFEHKAVLLLMGFGLTTVCGTCLSSHWKQLEWQNQQKYLLQQRDLDKQTELIGELTKAVAETNAAGEDILALYQQSELDRPEEIRERRDNWRKISREWRIASELLQQQLAIYFKNPSIQTKFDAILTQRRFLGNIIVRLPKRVQLLPNEVENAKKHSDELTNLTEDLGVLMRNEIRQPKSDQPNP